VSEEGVPRVDGEVVLVFASAGEAHGGGEASTSDRRPARAREATGAAMSRRTMS
jgi:hypothetical protein